MSEENDENIEKFFRAGTRRPDVGFNEDDWLALEARLDAEATRSAGIRRKRIAFFSLCFIVMLTTFLGFWHSYKNVNDIANEHSPAESGTESKASKDSSAESKRNETALKLKQVPSMAIYDHPAIRAEETGVSEKPLRNAGNTILPADSQAHEKSEENTSRYLSSFVLDKILTHDLTKVDVINALKDTISVLKPIENRDNTDSSAVPFDPDKKRYSRPHFSLMFFAAPEFSFTNRVRVTSPGSDLGIALYFHFNETISFSGGLIISRKKYVSSGSEYGIKEGYWKANTNGIVPDKIIGSCNIVEVPLTLQLRLLKKENNHFFIASGTSSYFMLNESYTYKFNQPNAGAKDGWSSEKNTTFAFSTINFSISYERNISRSITIGLEPYAKLPVKKIGWPNLELFSSGVNINLRYKIFSR